MIQDTEAVQWQKLLIRLGGIFLVCVLLLNSIFLLVIRARELSETQFTIVESNHQSIVVELITGNFEIENLTHAGEIYHRITISGMHQTNIPGAPQVPSYSALLGVPVIMGLSVRVLNADYELFTGYKLYPAPRYSRSENDLNQFNPTSIQETYTLDADRYAADIFHPNVLAEIGETGYMRDQAVAQFRFYPIQYNPMRSEIRLYRSIMVQITWDTDVQTISEERWHTTEYENLLRKTLLNYDALQRGDIHFPVHTVNPHNTDNGNDFDTADNFLPALKMSINESGLYRLNYSDLKHAGLNPDTLDPRTLQIQNQSIEIPIYVHGEEDGTFDDEDYILFYGTAINNIYTTQNVYWLSVAENAGARMMARDGTPTENIASYDRFLRKLHTEQDTDYWQGMPGSSEDRWFWGKQISPNAEGIPESRSYEIPLDNIYTGEAVAIVRVRLKGFTSFGHSTRIYLNNILIDEQTWYGQVQFDHEVSISHSLLANGINIIQVEAIDVGERIDQVLVNWLEVEYWDTYTVENDQLAFGTNLEGKRLFEVDGFVNSDVTILDITNVQEPVRLLNATVIENGGHYRMIFEDDATYISKYVAVTSSKYKSPTSIVVDQPSFWKSPNNEADYIIITHEDFYTSALRLANHRIASGLRVATVKVGDIYDEFSAGIFSPMAIRDFLSYTYDNWREPAPVYVLLIGDAYQDYKDNLRSGTLNYVPSQNIIGEVSGEVSSDNWFVTVHGEDILPDMFIGRLSVQSIQEASDIVEKIIDYEQNPPDESWNRNILLVADDSASIFQDTAEQLAARYPYYYNLNRVYVGTSTSGDPRGDIINQINQGSILVNYVGHGEYFSWGMREDNGDFIFNVSDVESLNNAKKLSIVIVANCLNGFFAGVKDRASLAEVLLRRKNGGAVAVWAPTGYGYTSDHQVLMNNFYDAIFVDDHTSLGAATTAAKLATFAYGNNLDELIETYLLFGDPAMQVGIPTNFPYIQSTSPSNGVDDVSLDENIQVVFNKPMNPDTVEISNTIAEKITFTPTWNVDFTSVNFSQSGFEHGKSYEIEIRGQDKRGNSLQQGMVPALWSFVATIDTTAPHAIVEIQETNLSSVLATAILKVSFTKPVRPESVTYSINPSIDSSLNWEPDNQKIIFSHQPFRVGETYTFSILTAIDIAGNSLPEPVQLSFTVGETFYSYLPNVVKNN